MAPRAEDELVHRELPSPNWDERALPISMVVLHYTEMEPEAALRRLTDPEAKVSAHYFISEDGEVVRLVEEGKRAWHAGASYWRSTYSAHGEGNANEAARNAAGWDLCLGALDRALADAPGVATAALVGEPETEWRRAYRAYLEAGFPTGAFVPEL